MSSELMRLSFLIMKLFMYVKRLHKKGVRIIVAGLDMDYLGKPFGPMPSLMSIAEFVTKVNAICMVCGDLATHTYRKTSDKTVAA